MRQNINFISEKRFRYNTNTSIGLGILKRNRQIILYGLCLGLLLLVLKLLEWHFIIVYHAFEVYATAIALIFTGLGIWLAIKLTKPKEKMVIVEKEVFTNPNFILNQTEIERLRISSRELEILQLIADGLTNQQIAERLFLSLNTIKTHTKNLFLKMEVERRTQAIEKAKRLSLIP